MGHVTTFMVATGKGRPKGGSIVLLLVAYRYLIGLKPVFL